MNEQLVISSDEAAVTEQFGESIGRRLRGGEVVELIADVGGGKTTFTRGLARGASSTDHVASPTFTIAKQYKAPHFTIHHFDFYRLQDAGLMQHELHDLVGDPTVVVVVEWSDIVQHILPAERLVVEFLQTATDGRELHIRLHESLYYLVRDVI